MVESFHLFLPFRPSTSLSTLSLSKGRKIKQSFVSVRSAGHPALTGFAGHGGFGGLGEGGFSFFNVLLVLVHLVLLVVFLIFSSLFLQLVLPQRIVDIYVCIKKKEFFVPSDSGASTWWFGVSESHF
jgi:hypothetical protein